MKSKRYYLLALLLLSLLTLTAVIHLSKVTTPPSPPGEGGRGGEASVSGLTISAIAQDSTGLIWLGTDRGLVSYDGYHHRPRYAPGTPSATHVYALHIEGNIISLATSGGLLQYDIKQGRYLPPVTDKRRNKDLRALNPQRPTSLHDANVYSLLPTPHGLLVGTTRGLYVEKNGKRRALPLSSDKSQPLVNALARDMQGNQLKGYWLGTEGALYHIDTNLHTPQRITALDGNSIKTLAQTLDGTLHIGTDNGLYTLSPDGGVNHFTHDTRDARSIPNNIVWSIFVDRSQNVWLGTDNGLARFNTRSFATYLPLADITGTGEGNFLHELLQTSDGSWWLGGTNGLIHFDGPLSAGGTHTAAVTWYKQNSALHPLTHNRVRKIYEDRNHDLWVCTDHGINLLDRATGHMRNFILHDPAHHYSSTWAYDILHDPQGRLWVAAYDGGIFIIDKRRLIASSTVSVQADRHIADGPHALSGIHVGQLARAADGTIWASTYNGLDGINPTTLRVVNHLHDMPVHFLLSDHAGQIWAAGNNEVWQFAPGQSPRRHPIEGSVRTMCEVDGRIWAVCGSVCSILDGDKPGLRFRIPHLVPQTLCYAPREGMVVMGGNDGICCLTPAASSQRTSSAPLLLTAIRTNGRERPDSLNDITDGTLRLEPREKSIVLQLSDLPFDGTPQLTYVYRLEGIDTDWRTLDGEDLDISYDALPYGHHPLSVCLVDAAGQRGAEVFALDIYVAPPWYLTLWAKLLYALAAVALVFWAMNFYLMRRRLAEEQRQKAEIIEQTEARMRFFDRLSEQLKQPLACLMNALFAFPTAVAAQPSKEQQAMRRATAEMNSLVLRLLDTGTTTTADTADPKAQSLTTPPLLRERGLGGEAATDVVALCRAALTDFPDCRLEAEAEHILLPLDALRAHAMIVLILRFMRQKCHEADTVPALTLSVQTTHGEQSALTLLFEGPVPLVTPDTQSAFFQIYQNAAEPLLVAKDYAERHNGTLLPAPDGHGLRLDFPLEAADKDKGQGEQKRPTPATAPDERFLTELTQIIEKNLSDSEFNVTTLQEKMGMGGKQLYRKLKAATDRTPVEYIRDVRMRKAALLLGEGKFTVSEVMYTVGFTSSSYFSKCFQKTFGMKPTEYVRRGG